MRNGLKWGLLDSGRLGMGFSTTKVIFFVFQELQDCLGLWGLGEARKKGSQIKWKTVGLSMDLSKVRNAKGQKG